MGIVGEGIEASVEVDSGFGGMLGEKDVGGFSVLVLHAVIMKMITREYMTEDVFM